MISSDSGNMYFPTLNLPPADLRISRKNNIIFIYDPLRKKDIILTPEEYVRQNFVSWIINSLHYPKSIIANEIGISLNGTKKRCDTVVFNSSGNPLMIIEYKAPNITINQNVFDQIVRYNMTLRAKYLVVSNGINHFCCKIDYSKGNYVFQKKIPDYNDIRPHF